MAHILDRREIRRQLIHFGGIVSVPLAFYLGTALVAGGALLAALALGFLSYLSKHRDFGAVASAGNHRGGLPLAGLKRNIYDLLNSVERKEELEGIPYLSAVTFFLAAGLAYLFLPLGIASLAMAVLAAGDSISTLVGSTIGSHPLPWREEKSWEGFFAGTLSSAIVGSLVCILFSVPLLWAPLAALVGAVAEAYARPIDDNLLIVIAVSSVLLTLTLL